MANKEVRDILLRRMVRYDEQFWTVAPSDASFHFHGVRDGAGDVRLFGVTHLTRNYQLAELELSAALSAAEMALHSMGLPIRLRSMPEAKSCLFTPNWIAPVLLAVAQDGAGLRMTAYSGRSLLFGRLRCYIAMRLLERRLPDGITWAGKEKKTDREELQGKEAKTQKSLRKTGKKTVSPKKKKTAPKRLQK